MGSYSSPLAAAGAAPSTKQRAMAAATICRFEKGKIDLDIARSSAFIVNHCTAVSRGEIVYFLELAFMTICTSG
jgi:hypothetical protein